MRDSWLELLDSVLRPARPHLERCLRERDRHLAERRPFTEERTRAIAQCVAEIETARALAFAADDGVVPSRMTDLERRWRRLSRPDADAGLMDLWARTAPAAWIDRKRWRDSEPACQLDAAVALAADVEGVEAAEAAIDSLRVALAGWGTRLGARVRWCVSDDDFEDTVSLFAEPLRAASEALVARGVEPVVRERAQQLERDVHDAAIARFAERPVLAHAIAHAAMVDCVLRAASLAGRPNPVMSLRALWRSGYVLHAADSGAVTVAITQV